MKRSYSLLSILLMSCLSYLWCISDIFAASFQGLSVFPASYEAGKEGSSARFDLELYPGETHRDSIKISNKSGKDAVYKLFAADGKTTADGAFALGSFNDPKTEVGSWISLETEEITVPNNQETEVFFTVAVPADTEVGDHLGGISVFDVNQNEQQTDDNGFMLNITTRVGVRIYVTVPGEIVKKMEISDFVGGLDTKTDKVVLNFSLKNTGNVRLEPKGEITILNSVLGTTAESFPIDLRMVLPDSPTKVPIVWDQTPLGGKYTVRATIHYGERPNELLQKDFELFFVTKKAKIGMGVAGAVLVLVVLFVLRKLLFFR